MALKSDLERRFSRGLFRARWILAPIYLGLAVALVLLMMVFIRDLVRYVPIVLFASAEHSILAILTLIDLALSGNLLLLVIFSGYGNFVAKLDFGEDDKGQPNWLASVDFSGIKLNLLASIVGISAIYLLRWYMEIGESEEPTEAVDEIRLRWLVIVHLTFVTSGVMLALMDRLSPHKNKD